MKIAIGIPHLGNIKSKTAFSLMEVIRVLPYEFMPIFRYGNYISENKESIIETAVEQKCTHILFIDSDMIFTPDDIDKLIIEDKDVVGVSYNFRYLPLTSMVKLFPNNVMRDEIFKVAALPGGCLLINLDTFNKIDKPYFPMEYENGKVVCTEDVGFCEKVREAGVDVWCNPTLEIKHIGDYEY